jgi:DNA repair protein RadC
MDVLSYSSMAEREPSRDNSVVPQFGEKLPSVGRRGKQRPTTIMFQAGDDLPLFSGTPIPARESVFVPEDRSMKQAALPGMPAMDYDHILAKDKELYRRRKGAELQTNATLFQAVFQEPTDDDGRPNPVQELVRPYLDLVTLKRLAATGEDIRAAVRSHTELPEEISKLLNTIRALLRPADGERIKSPADMAALLMVEMSHLDQEQMRVACLDTKNKLQKLHVVYQGSLNTSLIRVGEIFKEPVKLNSAAVILAHNHPSGEPEPSPEDVLVTREIVAAGTLLDVEVLDHLVIGQGRYVSLRQRGLGFHKD